MKKPATVFLLFTTALSGCYFDKEEELYPNNNCNTASVSFSNHISTIITTKCATAGCHVAGGISPNLSDYTAVSSNISRVKSRAIDARTMPPASAPKLTDCEYQQLSVWINNGAKND